MKQLIALLLAFGALLLYAKPPKSASCAACHPRIYAEYQRSMHANASATKDKVHLAVWNRHPLKKQGRYSCAKCHSPADDTLAINKRTNKTEPFSCQSCHKIQDIELHAKANRNILTSKKKYFFSADPKQKGKKLIFHEETRLYGLIRKTIGSPYHDIDYSNDGYYTGQMCMGCHSHKQNDHNFDICNLEVKQNNSQATCISCHMPQKPGALANLKHTKTHAFHGSSIHGGTPAHLSQYIKLSLQTEAKGFTVTIQNKATHTLFPHPLRLGQLRVFIHRNGKDMPLEARNYARVIGANGKPTMPWEADMVIKDTTIKALQKRSEYFDTALKQGDRVTVELGYYIVNPAAAKQLGLTDPKTTDFIVLTKKQFEI